MSGFSPAAVIVHPSGTNNVGYEKEYPLWITGTTGPTFISGTVNVDIKNTSINITGSVDVANVISASVVNFPAVQVVTGTVRADITGTVNVSVQSQPNITGSVNVTNSVFPVTGTVTNRSEAVVFGPSPSYAQQIAGAYYSSSYIPGYQTPMRSSKLGEPLVRLSPYFETNFGRIRSATPFTLFDSVSYYELDPREFGSLTGSGGSVSYSTTTGLTSLNATTTSGSTAKIRSHTNFRYQAGKQHVALITGFVSSFVSNNVKRWGLFDDSDGIFWEVSGSNINLVRRTSAGGAVVDNVVSQSAWSFDRLDGSGLSGFRLDATKMNIYETHHSWLGVGPVKCFVNGNLCHTFDSINSLTVPYIRTLSLPVSIECVSNNTTSTGSAFVYNCSNVTSDGGSEPPEYSFAAYNASDITLSSTERPVLSIRVSALYQGLSNRMILLPKLLIVSTESGRAGYRIAINGTLTGASWTSVSSYSGAQYDESATAMTGGETILRGLLPQSNDAREIDISSLFAMNARKIRKLAFTNESDILTILMVNEGVGSITGRASITWNEVR